VPSGRLKDKCFLPPGLRHEDPSREGATAAKLLPEV